MKHTLQAGLAKPTSWNKKTVAALVAALCAMAVPTFAMAADYVGVNDNGEVGRGNLTGDGAIGRYAISVGVNTQATGLSGVSVGTNAAASGESSVALGSYSVANDRSSVAIGQEASATENAAVALGRQTYATAGSSTALGSNAAATAMNTTAVGVGATASEISATSVGQNSKATAAKATASGEEANATAISSSAYGNGAVASGTFSTALGASATASGNASVAAGLQSAASGGSSVALGRFANATEEYSVALGSGATTEAAVGTNAATVNGVTYSGFAGTVPVATVSVGSAGSERTLTNMAAGRITATSTDAINGSQLYVLANNVQANVNAANSKVAAGTNIVVTPVTSTTDGSTTYTVATSPDLVVDSVNAGNTVLNNGGVTINNGSAGSPVSLTQSGLNNGGNTITNVASGTNPTDAVNVGQLNSAKTEVVAGDNVTVDKTIGANGQDIYKISADTSAWDNRINNRINDMDKDLRAGIAGATAIAFLQRPNEAGKSLVSMAVGGYRDQQALAVGYARNSDNNKWSVKAGVGVNTRKDVNWGGSVGYQW